MAHRRLGAIMGSGTPPIISTIEPKITACTIQPIAQTPMAQVGTLIIQGLTHRDHHGHEHPGTGHDVHKGTQGGNNPENPDDPRGAGEPDGPEQFTMVGLGLGFRAAASCQ